MMLGERHHEIRAFKTMTLDVCCKAIEVEDFRLRLSAGEFEILELLTRRPGMIYTRQQMMDVMFGDHAGYYTDRTIDSHIKRMRKQGVPGIFTHYGTGYFFEDRSVPPVKRNHLAERDKIKLVKARCCDHCGAPIPHD